MKDLNNKLQTIILMFTIISMIFACAVWIESKSLTEKDVKNIIHEYAEILKAEEYFNALIVDCSDYIDSYKISLDKDEDFKTFHTKTFENKTRVYKGGVALLTNQKLVEVMKEKYSVLFVDTLIEKIFLCEQECDL